MTGRLVLDWSDNNPLPTRETFAALGAVIVKLTEGVRYINPLAAEVIELARSTGTPVGGYHFFHPEESVPDQVAIFASQLRRFSLKRAFVDVELNLAGGTDPVMTPVEWQELDHLAERFSKGLFPDFAVDLYTDLDFIENGVTPWREDLWLACYGRGEPPAVKPPRPCALWQFTDTGRLPGIDADVDLSYAYSADLARYFA